MAGNSNSLLGRVSATFRRFRSEKAANVAVIFALAMVPTIGVFGLGVEGSIWLMGKRAEQNAADGAVLAAAAADQSELALGDAKGLSAGTPNCTSCYAEEGKGVATKHGFTNGASNTAVSVQKGQSCLNINPELAGMNGYPNVCYKVTISRPMELLFTRLIGFRGDNTVLSAGGGSSSAQTLRAIAYAGPVPVQVPVCVLGLKKNDSQTIRLNGAPRADLGDCTIFSDGGADCNGHNSGAWIGGAVGTDGGSAGCGIAQFSNQPYVPDPYSSLAAKIPAYTCPNYSGVTLNGGSYTAATLSTAVGASMTSGGDTYLEVCGNLTLSGNVSIAAGNNVIVVINGQTGSGKKGVSVGYVNTGGAAYTLSTSGTAGVDAAGLTMIFQGSDATVGPFDSGMNVDFSAPTSGTWSGVSIYDPEATSVLYKGNSPGWALSGINYFPNTDMDWRGVIGKSTSGFQCFDLVVNTLLIDGTAQMFNPSLAAATSQCGRAGAKLPTTLGYKYVLTA